MKTTTKTHIYYVDSWIYNNEPFTDNCHNHFGFIYCITNKLDGKKYIGKRLFSKAAYKNVKGKRKKIRKESDWREYFGSGSRLQAAIEKEGKENFSREILRFCDSRGECNFWELYEIMRRKAIRSPEYYNDWWKGTISRKHLIIGEDEKWQ
jgi:hypothetical protein